MIQQKLLFRDQVYDIQLQETESGEYLARLNDKEVDIELKPGDRHRFMVRYKGKRYSAFVASSEDTLHVSIDGHTFTFKKADAPVSDHRPGMEDISHDQNTVEAPMPGKLLKIFVTEGQKISRNDRLFIVEAMKMENEVRAPRDGIIQKINFKESDLVSVGEAIIEFARTEETQDT